MLLAPLSFRREPVPKHFGRLGMRVIIRQIPVQTFSRIIFLKFSSP